MTHTLRNWEIATYALHLLGGTSQHIPTEMVALKCFELAPDSFSWVTRADLPDKDVARTALTDSRKSKNGTLVTGRAGRGKGQASRSASAGMLDGWMLTEAGVEWVSQNAARVSEILGYRQASTHRQDQLHKLSRIRSHELFQDFLDRPQTFNPDLGRMADLFRCRVDSDLATWNRRFRTAINLAHSAQDSEVLDFVRKCEIAVEAHLSSSS